jgi:hypothetical protein
MKKASILIFIVIVVVMAILISGCDGFAPNNNPNEEFDEENSVLDYIKVIPGKIEISFNQSQKFEVKAYNSDNKQINLDVSKLKWTCTYQCIGCGVVCNVSPIYNSTVTTFKATDPKKTGRFEVWVNYGGTSGKWAKAVVNVK